jgi:hypothetical protein
MAGAAPSALAAASEPAIAFPAAESAAAAEAAMPEPATQPAAEAPSPMHLTMPAALRPIDFREYEDADDSQARVPLRSISLPPAATGETPSPAIIPSGLEPDETPGTAQHDAPAGLGESIPETGEDVVEDAYSSLLDLSRPVASRQQFVRIEEQDADSGEIEPVVIFPGQAAPTGGRFSAPGLKPVAVEPVADLDAPAGDSPVRRFDAPGNAPAAVAARPAGAPLGQDAAETEQALRSALASLQRMSGAA